jgi:hypothetical protein
MATVVRIEGFRQLEEAWKQDGMINGRCVVQFDWTDTMSDEDRVIIINLKRSVDTDGPHFISCIKVSDEKLIITNNDILRICMAISSVAPGERPASRAEREVAAT